MNKIYKIVWNDARNCYVVASEFASAKDSSGVFRSSYVNQMARRAANAAVVIMAALLTWGFVPGLNDNNVANAAAPEVSETKNHQYVALSPGGNWDTVKTWPYVFVTDDNTVVHSSTGGDYKDGTTGGTMAADGKITDGNEVRVGTDHYKFTSYKDGVYTLTSTTDSNKTLNVYRYGLYTKDNPDGSKTAYRIRNDEQGSTDPSYNVSIVNQGGYYTSTDKLADGKTAPSSKNVFVVSYQGQGNAPKDVLTKVDHVTSDTGVRTNLQEQLQTVNASTYTSAATGGSTVGGTWDYYIYDDATNSYKNMHQTGSGNIPMRFSLVSDNNKFTWSDAYNAYVYTNNGTETIVPQDNMYVIGGNLGIFTNSDGSLYTGTVYGGGNEILLTTSVDGKIYSFWGAQSVDTAQTMATYPVAKYNTDIETLTNNDKILDHNDINSLKGESAGTSLTLGLYRNGSNMNGDKNATNLVNGSEIKFEASGGTGGIAANEGGNDRTLTISGGGASHPFNMGSRVGVTSDLVSGTSDLQRLTINGTPYNLRLNFQGDTGNAITKDLGSTLAITGGATTGLTTGNIGVVNENGALNVRLKKDVDLGSDGSLTMNNTKVTADGLNITGGPSVTLSNGVNAGGKQVTNVASGTSGNLWNSSSVGYNSNWNNGADIGDIHQIAKQDIQVDGTKNINVASVTDNNTGVRTSTVSLSDNVTLGEAGTNKSINLNGTNTNDGGTITMGTGNNQIKFNSVSGQGNVAGVKMGTYTNADAVTPKVYTSTEEKTYGTDPTTYNYKETTVNHSGTDGTVEAGTFVTGLTNTNWDWRNLSVVSGRAATEDQVLKAGQHFFSINPRQNVTDLSTIPNYYNDGAQGEASIAIGHGVSTNPTADGSIAIGANGTTTGRKSASNGTTTYSGGEYALAVGNAAKAEGDESMAIGHQADAAGDRSLSIGNNNYANGIRSIAIGVNVQSGYQNDYADVNQDSYASGKMIGGANIAVGNRTRVNGTGSTALGYGATVGKINSDGSMDTNNGADLAVALGGRTEVTQDGGVALGNTSVSNRAAGSNNAYMSQYATGADGNVSADAVKAAQSTDSMGTLKATYTQDGSGKINGATKNTLQAGTAWRSNMGAVSIGADAARTAVGGDSVPVITRQLTGLAAGTEDTDAVNVAQLKALTAAGTNYQGNNSSVTVHRNVGDTLYLQGDSKNFTEDDSTKQYNIYATGNNTDGSIKLQLNDDLKLHTVTLGTASGTNSTEGEVRLVSKNGTTETVKAVTGQDKQADLSGNSTQRLQYTDSGDNGKTHTVATLEDDGLKFGGDDAKTDANKKVVRTLADQELTITGGADTNNLSTAGNVGVVSNTDGNGLEIRLNKDITDLNTVTAGTVKMGAQTNVPVTDNASTNPGTESGNYVTGLDNKTWEVGQTHFVSGRAATEDQLKAVSDQTKTNQDNIAKGWNAVVDNGSTTNTSINVNPDKNNLNIKQGDNIALTADKDNQTITVATKPDVKFNSVTVRKTGDTTGGIVLGNQADGNDTSKSGYYATGLDNKDWEVGKTTPVSGRAATEDQLKTVDNQVTKNDTRITTLEDGWKLAVNDGTGDDAAKNVKAGNTVTIDNKQSTDNQGNIQIKRTTSGTDPNANQTISLGLNKDITLGAATGNTNNGGSLRVNTGENGSHVKIDGNSVKLLAGEDDTLTNERITLGSDTTHGGYITMGGAASTSNDGHLRLYKSTDGDTTTGTIPRLAYVDPEDDTNTADVHTVATLDDGTTYAGDSGNAKVALNKQVTVTGAATDATDSTKWTTGNISVAAEATTKDNAADGNAKLTLKLKNELDGIKSIGQNGNTINFGDTNNAGITLKGGDVNVSSNKITNVKAGEADNDAVNVSQLKNATGGWDVQTNGTALKTVSTATAGTDDTTAKNARTLNFKNGDNIAITGNGNDITVGTTGTVGFTTVHVAGNGTGSSMTEGITIGTQSGMKQKGYKYSERTNSDDGSYTITTYTPAVDTDGYITGTTGTTSTQKYKSDGSKDGDATSGTYDTSTTSPEGKYITGLTNTGWTGGQYVSGRAATEDQLATVAQQMLGEASSADIYATGGDVSYESNGTGNGTLTMSQPGGGTPKITGLHDYYISDASLSNNTLTIARNDATKTGDNYNESEKGSKWWSVDLSGLVTPDMHLVGAGTNQTDAYKVDKNGDVTLTVTDGQEGEDHTKTIKISGLSTNFGANSSQYKVNSTDENYSNTHNVVVGETQKIIGSAKQDGHTYSDTNITTELDSSGNIHIMMDTNPTIHSVTFNQGGNSTTLNLTNEGDKLYYTKDGDTTNKTYIATTGDGLSFQGNNTGVTIAKKLSDTTPLKIVGDSTSTEVADGSNVYVTGNDGDDSLKIQLGKNISGFTTIKAGDTTNPITIGTQTDGSTTNTGNYITGLTNTNWTSGGTIVENRAATEGQLKAVQDSDKYVSAATFTDGEKGAINGTLTVKNGTNVTPSGLHDYYVTSGTVVTGTDGQPQTLRLTKNNDSTVDIDISKLVSTDYQLVANPAEGSEGVYTPDENGDMTLTVKDPESGKTNTIKLSGLVSKTNGSVSYAADNTEYDGAGKATNHLATKNLGAAQKILGKETGKTGTQYYTNGNVRTEVTDSGDIVISMNDNPVLKSVILQGTGNDEDTVTLAKGAGDNTYRLTVTPKEGAAQYVAYTSDALSFQGNSTLNSETNSPIKKSLNSSALSIVGEGKNRDNQYTGTNIKVVNDTSDSNGKLVIETAKNFVVNTLQAGSLTDGDGGDIGDNKQANGKIRIIGDGNSSEKQAVDITAGYQSTDTKPVAPTKADDTNGITRVKYQGAGGTATQHVVATLEDGYNLSGDTTMNGTTSADKVGIGLDKDISIKGGASASEVTTDATAKNIGVKVTKTDAGNAELQLLLNKDLTGLTTVTAGTAKLGNQSVTYSLGGKTAADTGDFVTGLTNKSWYVGTDSDGNSIGGSIQGDNNTYAIVSGRAATEDQLLALQKSLSTTIKSHEDSKFGLKPDEGDAVQKTLGNDIDVKGAIKKDKNGTTETDTIIYDKDGNPVKVKDKDGKDTETNQQVRNVVTSNQNGAIAIDLADHLNLGISSGSTGSINLYGNHETGTKDAKVVRINPDGDDGTLTGGVITITHKGANGNADQKDGIRIQGPSDTYLNADGTHSYQYDTNGSFSITNNLGQVTARLGDSFASGYLGLGNTLSTMEKVNSGQIRHLTTALGPNTRAATSSDTPLYLDGMAHVEGNEQRDDYGQVIYQKYADGKPVYLTDKYGNLQYHNVDVYGVTESAPIPAMTTTDAKVNAQRQRVDDYGQVVYRVDGNGNVLYQTDSDGNIQTTTMYQKNDGTWTRDANASDLSGKTAQVGTPLKDVTAGAIMFSHYGEKSLNNNVNTKGTVGSSTVDGDSMTRMAYWDEDQYDPSTTTVTGSVPHEIATLDDGIKLSGNTLNGKDTTANNRLNKTLTIQGTGTTTSRRTSSANVYTRVHGNESNPNDGTAYVDIGLNRDIRGLSTIQVGGTDENSELADNTDGTTIKIGNQANGETANVGVTDRNFSNFRYVDTDANSKTAGTTVGPYLYKAEKDGNTYFTSDASDTNIVKEYGVADSTTGKLAYYSRDPKTKGVITDTNGNPTEVRNSTMRTTAVTINGTQEASDLLADGSSRTVYEAKKGDTTYYTTDVNDKNIVTDGSGQKTQAMTTLHARNGRYMTGLQNTTWTRAAGTIDNDRSATEGQLANLQDYVSQYHEQQTVNGVTTGGGFALAAGDGGTVTSNLGQAITVRGDADAAGTSGTWSGNIKTKAEDTNSDGTPDVITAFLDKDVRIGTNTNGTVADDGSLSVGGIKLGVIDNITTTNTETGESTITPVHGANYGGYQGIHLASGTTGQEWSLNNKPSYLPDQNATAAELENLHLNNAANIGDIYNIANQAISDVASGHTQVTVNGGVQAPGIAEGETEGAYSTGGNLQLRRSTVKQGDGTRDVYDLKLGDNINIGEKGADGKDGVDGKIGVNGKDGSAVVINGKDGSIGLNGKDGANGLTIKGDKGANGVDGTDGANGKDGMTRIVYETEKPDPNDSTKTIITKHEVATLDDGQKYAGDDYKAADGDNPEQNVITKKMNQRLDIKGNSGDKELTDKNIGVKVDKDKDGNEYLHVQLAKDLEDLNSVTFGDKGGNHTVINNTGMTIYNSNNPNDPKNVKITNNNISMGGQQIHNVAAGEKDTDAVNLSQLNQEVAKVNNTVSAGDNIKVETTGEGPKNYKVSLDNDVTLGKAGEAGKLALTDKNGNKTIELDGDTGVIKTGGVQMSKDGLVAGDKQITKVASGLADKDGNKIALKDATGDTLKNAVNVGDLKDAVDDVNETITNVDNRVTNLDNTVKKGLDFQGDVGDKVNRQLGDTLNLNGGETDKDKLTDLHYDKDKKHGNIGVIRNDADNGLDIRLAKDLKGLDSVEVKDTTIDEKGVTIVDKDKDGKETGKTTVMNGAGTTVTNNTTDKDGNQISTKTELTDSGTKVTNNTTDKDGNKFTTTTNYGDGGMTINTSVTTKDGQTGNAQTVQVSQTNVTMGGNQVHNIGSGYTGQQYQGRTAAETQVLNNAASIGDLEAKGAQITNNLGGAINKLDNRVNKVGAGAAALAALHPQDFDPDDKWDFAAGYGNYRNANAVAVGAFYRPTEDILFSVGGSTGGGENMVNVGMTFKLGNHNHVTNSRVAMAKEILAMQTKMDAMAKELQTLKAGGAVNAAATQTKDINFPDVPENHWAYEYVQTLAHRGLLAGYPDGEFKGDRPMTRYEYAAILYRALQNGAPVDGNMARSMDEFGDEIADVQRAYRFRVDRISGDDNDRNKIERVRVNDKDDPDNNDYRDVYGSKIQKAVAEAQNANADNAKA